MQRTRNEQVFHHRRSVRVADAGRWGAPLNMSRTQLKTLPAVLLIIVCSLLRGDSQVKRAQPKFTLPGRKGLDRKVSQLRLRIFACDSPGTEGLLELGQVRT